eukprot:CAMPEP_0115020028 /NCGR_PEP_ID=MMETSP0216-20121206/29841_1 /TAXON_ID=223996 /ORGANISM="Protocruzia adherens, Strain Boccale" /LENGTH=317 /DNA_ID=CAMNT_0002391703 /DNA_START=123 /DNA_END=1076 /DNA_ORIENTATION=-
MTVLSKVAAFCKLYLESEVDLKERYGDNSWALVTGSTDGIGKALSLALASKGFNIVLVSRNEQKLRKVREEIERRHGVNVKHLVCDFSECNFEAKHLEEVFKEIDRMNVSILVNNVGIAQADEFDFQEESVISDMLNVNICPQVFLSHFLLPKFLRREKRSAIINLSSVFGVDAIPYFSVYGATKAFNDVFSHAMHYEYKSKVDVLSVKPLRVITAQHPEGSRKTPDQISAEECAAGIIEKLGRYQDTAGHNRHVFYTWMASTLLPSRMSIKLRKKLGGMILKSSLQRRQERQRLENEEDEEEKKEEFAEGEKKKNQ